MVSGSGDGGLIDLARASIRSDPSAANCRHDQLVALLTEKEGFSEMAKKMQEIDRMYEKNPAGADLFQRYQAIPIPEEIAELMRSLRRRFNEVIFNYTHPGVFTITTALINRLVAFLILKLEIVKEDNVIQGRMKPPTAGSRKTVIVNARRSIHVKDLDLIVTRHGVSARTAAENLLLRTENVARIKEACEEDPDIPLLSDDLRQFWEVTMGSQLDTP